MKFIRLVGVACLAFASLTASAQSEQWLNYSVRSEGTGYRWLDVTTNAPAGVTLPKLAGPALFVRWDTPLDPKGRWMCFDRTRRAGPHDRLFIDSKGDGRLDGEAPIDAVRVDEYSAMFEPARLVFQGEDGPFTYHLVLRFMRYSQGDMRVLAQSGSVYTGNVRMGEQQVQVTLLDVNVNGTFNDRAPNPSDCDAIVVGGEQDRQRYLGEMLEIEDELFAVEVAQDGAYLKVQPARDVVLAPVFVPESVTEVTVVGGPGHFIRQPARGQFTIPAGAYRVHGWAVERKDEQGVPWRLSGSGFSESAGFQARVDEPATLPIGEPALVALTVSENRGGASFGLRLKGQLGETVQVLRDGRNPRPPRLHLVSATGSFRATNTFEYG